MRGLLLVLLLLLLPACAPKPLPLPADWPLPQLTLPIDSRPLVLGKLTPADRPYYFTGNDDSFQPAKEALARLLAPLQAADSAPAADAYSFAHLPVHSSDGTAGLGWAVAFTSGRGWDSALQLCEAALKPLNAEIIEYRPGRLRTYYTRDRRMEVDLVAGKGDQLLLCICTYDPPLPSERELAQREDLRRAAHAIGEQLRTEALEIGAGKKQESVTRDP